MIIFPDMHGDVGDHTVVSGGYDDPHDTSVTIIGTDDPSMFRKTVRKESKLVTEDSVVAEKNDNDFESIAPYLMDLRVNRN